MCRNRCDRWEQSQSSVRSHFAFHHALPFCESVKSASLRTGAASIAACTSAAVAPRRFHSRASLNAGRGRDDPHRCRVGEQHRRQALRAALPGRVRVGHDHHARGPIFRTNSTSSLTPPVQDGRPTAENPKSSSAAVSVGPSAISSQSARRHSPGRGLGEGSGMNSPSCRP